MVIRGWLCGVACSVAWLWTSTLAHAETPPEPAARLIQRAQLAERLQQYDAALESWLQAYLAGERTELVRGRIHDNLRRAAQRQRMLDADYRKLCEGLSPAEALNLFADTLDKLRSHYAERWRATPARLFALAVEEITRALEQPEFCERWLPRADAAARRQFVDHWRRGAALRIADSVPAARSALQELVKSAASKLQCEHATPLILEAVCGACAGLDESTVYLPPGQAERDALTASTVPRAELIDAAGVGFIQIARFSEATPREFEDCLRRLQGEGMRALVLDLRGNPGGSLAAAIRLAERFIPSGPLASTRGQLAEFDHRDFLSSSGTGGLGLPLVVLVDGGTMSAAEVLAAALLDRGRATLVGVPTFGKGTVQSAVPLANAETGRLMITIARVLSATGNTFHGRGIVPHVIEPMPSLQVELAVARAAAMLGGM